MKKPLSEKKKLVRVIAFWVLCLVLGGGVGYLCAKLTSSAAWDPAALAEKLAPAASIALCVLFLAVNLIAAIWSGLQVSRLSKQAAALDPDDDAAFDSLESRLGVTMSILNILQIINMAVYPVLIWLVMKDSVTRNLGLIIMGVGTLVFLGMLFVSFFLNKRCVDLEKQLNPEKRGSLLDVSFAKQWEASCDEAQKKMIFESGYRAFRAGSTACMCLWLVCVIGSMLLDCGIVPVLCVCTIWLVMQIVYLRTAAHVEHGGRKE